MRVRGDEMSFHPPVRATPAAPAAPSAPASAHASTHTTPSAPATHTTPAPAPASESYATEKTAQKITMLARLAQEMKVLNVNTQQMTGFSNHPCSSVWQTRVPGRSGTAWAGAVYTLRLEFPENYPLKPPKCYFPVGFFHPNVSPSGRIAHPLLQYGWGWRATTTVKEVLLAVREMLHTPYIDTHTHTHATDRNVICIDVDADDMDTDLYGHRHPGPCMHTPMPSKPSMPSMPVNTTEAYRVYTQSEAEYNQMVVMQALATKTA
jgi:ubiquitin-protein ligase